MFRIKKGDVDSGQLPPCMLHALPSNYKKVYGKYILNRKNDTNSQEGYGWMIEDGQLLFDRMFDLLVVMELILCKCNRM